MHQQAAQGAAGQVLLSCGTSRRHPAAVEAPLPPAVTWFDKAAAAAHTLNWVRRSLDERV